MAQLLLAAGQEVALLAMIDTWPPEPAATGGAPDWFRPYVASAALLFQRLRSYRRTLRELPLREWPGFVSQKARALGGVVAGGERVLGVRREINQAMVEQATMEAMAQYEVRQYPGRIVYFRAGGRQVRPEQDTRGVWQTVAQDGLEVITLDGPDSGQLLVQPHVRQLAARLRFYLHADRHGVHRAPAGRAA